MADFSVEVAQAPVPNRPLQLRRLLWRTIAEAKGAGFSQDEIRQTFLPLLTDSNSLFANRYLMLFGLFPSALQVYADDMERNLAEERVVVEPVVLMSLIPDRPTIRQIWKPGRGSACRCPCIRSRCCAAAAGQ